MIPGLIWEATPSATRASLPCDTRFGLHADRAISIDASPTVVFAWLCQLRAVPYSYDILDSFGRRSPRRRNPDLIRLRVRQRLTLKSLSEREAEEQSV
jgi:hypothetical protein